ncbi:MAG: uracil-DNA glycosylase [Deltaproteobacteria bacterium]|nr:uracil-DNA glycosylase [Deltaproteobacteria bacterium]
MNNPSEPKPQTERTQIDCYACGHFYITYNPRFPLGCHATGARSRLLPSQEILNNSGLECRFFEEKAPLIKG